MSTKPKKNNSTPAINVTIEGDYPDLERTKTGLFSVDLALGGGLPTRSSVEIFGYEGSAKSTLGYYLAGRVASAYSGIFDLADVEGLDKEYLSRAVRSGASRDVKVRLVPLVVMDGKKTKPASAEDMLGCLRRRFSEETSAVAMLDSVSVLVPVSELEGELGEAQIARRAKLMAEFMRAATMWNRNKERLCNVLIINHLYQIIGARGSSTSGGNAIKNQSQVRMRLRPVDSGDDGSLIVQGTVEKLRYRPDDYTNKSFKFVTKPGYGVHAGLSAVRDCIDFGLAKEDRTIKLEEKTYGYWKSMLSEYEDNDRFQPFIEALAEYEAQQKQ